ncbi:hypothetical protein HYDPIDRAFT_28729 [Hydnomerulius pinastri MD-312]|uniref:CHAT domain-containing protein n=1 Tax=Hydnomerulius pinastri MD-312 TaxID=994086 RepID=A0A0C9VFJ5_9AGAM|nr:hypothetical protein HYDPIDRAFT_28729 [Hydnomerulius pinastri MD-312]
MSFQPLRYLSPCASAAPTASANSTLPGEEVSNTFILTVIKASHEVNLASPFPLGKAIRVSVQVDGSTVDKGCISEPSSSEVNWNHRCTFPITSSSEVVFRVYGLTRPEKLHCDWIEVGDGARVTLKDLLSRCGGSQLACITLATRGSAQPILQIYLTISRSDGSQSRGHDCLSKLRKLTSKLWKAYGQHHLDIDLATCISVERAALGLFQPGSVDAHPCLDDIATYLKARYNEHREIADLHEAIELQRRALECCQEGHSSRPAYHGNLAVYLKTRYNRLGGLVDLQEAIDHQRRSIAICPPDYKFSAAFVANLANQLKARYNVLGDVADLHEAIELGKQALVLRSIGHRLRHSSLGNLASYLKSRYDLQGNVVDLHQAVELARQALSLSPTGDHLQYSSLNRLSSYLRARHDLRGEVVDIDEAVEFGRQALSILQDGHPDRHHSLGNLANHLKARFSVRGEAADLEEAIALGRQTLSLRPSGHPQRPSCVGNLGSFLYERFELCGDGADLQEAIGLNREALSLRPPGHPLRCSSVRVLARCILSDKENDHAEAFDLYRTLERFAGSSSTALCNATQSWVRDAEKRHHPSALSAYRASISSLDHHLVATASVTLRHQVMQAFKYTPSDAFSCALRAGDLEQAVQLLEHGRGLLWNQLALLDTPLDQLRQHSKVGQSLAEEFQSVGSTLEKFAKGGGGGDTEVTTTEKQYWKAKRRWEDVVGKIREQDGFSRFLLPPLFCDLQEAAREGPVIIVNASQYTCDALIILHSRSPIHVPLSLTFRAASTLCATFSNAIKRAAYDSNDRGIIVALRSLWDNVVGPILRSLATVHPSSRIWWCPTSLFTTLPLHAAAPFRRGEENLSLKYIPSYTPSLSALARARRAEQDDFGGLRDCDIVSGPSSAGSQRIVMIGQAAPDGAKELELHAVQKELDAICSVLPAGISAEQVVGDRATDHGALEAFRKYSWVHLACHGNQHPTQPYESSLAMKNGPLTLLRIIREKFHNPEFAFMSACHTADVGGTTPDEVIHLAAGMQFAGFKSVIGSMWAVDDACAYKLVTAFYRRMFEGPSPPDYRRAAEALSKAAREVWNDMPLDQRIVFIHIGA